MKIQFIGTSGHGVILNRNLPCNLIDDCILLDCGEGTTKSLLKNNIPLQDIKAVFISHLHADHFLGIISFLWEFAFYLKNNENLRYVPPDIYVPEGMKIHLEEIIKHTFSPFERVGFDINIIELPESNKEGMNINISSNNYTIKWATTTHKPLCYAYKFNNLITFSGDTASPSQNLINLARGSKILIHESTMDEENIELAHHANHSTPSDAAKCAKQVGTEKLVLYHLPDLSTTDESRFIKGAIEIFENIEIAHDNDIIEI